MLSSRERLHGEVTCGEYGGALGDRSTVGRIQRLRKNTRPVTLHILLMDGMGKVMWSGKKGTWRKETCSDLENHYEGHPFQLPSS